MPSGDVLRRVGSGGPVKNRIFVSAYYTEGKSHPFLFSVDTETKEEDLGWPVLANGIAEMVVVPNTDYVALTQVASPGYALLDKKSRTFVPGLPVISPRVDNVTATPDGTKIFMSTSHADYRQIRCLDVATKTLITGYPLMAYYQRCIQASPDGTKIAVGYDEGVRYAIIGVANKTIVAGNPSASTVVQNLAWSLDSAKLFLTQSAAPGYLVLDVATKTFEAGWPALSSGATNLAVSPDGQRLFISTPAGDPESKGYSIVNLASKTLETGWPNYGHSLVINSASWSPDGKKIFLASSVDLAAEPLMVIDVATKTFETGWPDMDNLFTYQAIPDYDY